uniref:Uncharacterized protein n=1 Tax=Arundo donax TaxID=35708 RepID=A0A0A9DKD8_ARUDO
MTLSSSSPLCLRAPRRRRRTAATGVCAHSPRMIAAAGLAPATTWCIQACPHTPHHALLPQAALLFSPPPSPPFRRAQRRAPPPGASVPGLPLLLFAKPSLCSALLGSLGHL